MSGIQLPDLIGAIMGIGGLLLLAAVALHRAFRSSSRHPANRNCIRGLALALGGWCLLGLLIPLAVFFPESLAARATAVVVFVVATALVVAAISFALQGLYASTRREAVRRHGKKRALAALALSSSFFAFFWVSAYKAEREKQLEATSQTAASSLPRSASFPELNFKIGSVPSSWRRVPADTSSGTAVEYRREGSQDVFAIRVKPVGFAPSHTSESAFEVFKRHLMANTENSILLSEELGSLDGIQGIVGEVENTRDGKKFKSRIWVGVHNGYLYDVGVYLGDVASSVLRQECEAAWGGFRILDKTRLAVPLAPKSTQDFHSEEYGFDVALVGSQWGQPSQPLTLFPLAQFSASNTWIDGVMAVHAIHLNGHDPSTDDLLEALRRLVDSAHSSFKYAETQSSRREGAGARLVYERKIKDQGYNCVADVRKTQKCAFFCTIWIAKNGQASKDAVEETLKRFTLSPSEAKVATPDELSAEDRKVHALIFNHLGAAKSADSRHQEALKLFLEAQRHTPLDSTIAANVAGQHNYMGAHKEALLCLDAHITLVESSDLEALPLGDAGIQNIRAVRARTLVSLERTEEAIASFQSLFSDGCRDVDILLSYADLLYSEERPEQAVAVLEDFLEQALPAPDVIVYLAYLYVELDREAEAVAMLEAEVSKPNAALGVWYTLAEIHLDAEKYAACLAVCVRLVLEEEDSGYACFLKGEAEAGLKRYSEARKSFEEAIAIEPYEVQYQIRRNDMVERMKEHEAATLRS